MPSLDDLIRKLQDKSKENDDLINGNGSELSPEEKATALSNLVRIEEICPDILTHLNNQGTPTITVPGTLSECASITIQLATNIRQESEQTTPDEEAMGSWTKDVVAITPDYRTYLEQA